MSNCVGARLDPSVFEDLGDVEVADEPLPLCDVFLLSNMSDASSDSSEEPSFLDVDEPYSSAVAGSDANTAAKRANKIGRVISFSLPSAVVTEKNSSLVVFLIGFPQFRCFVPYFFLRWKSDGIEPYGALSMRTVV